jgi:hypothetical protein
MILEIIFHHFYQPNIITFISYKSKTWIYRILKSLLLWWSLHKFCRYLTLAFENITNFYYNKKFSIKLTKLIIIIEWLRSLYLRVGFIYNIKSNDFGFVFFFGLTECYDVTWRWKLFLYLSDLIIFCFKNKKQKEKL